MPPLAGASFTSLANAGFFKISVISFARDSSPLMMTPSVGWAIRVTAKTPTFVACSLDFIRAATLTVCSSKGPLRRLIVVATI